MHTNDMFRQNEIFNILLIAFYSLLQVRIFVEHSNQLSKPQVARSVLSPWSPDYDLCWNISINIICVWHHLTDAYNCYPTLSTISKTHTHTHNPPDWLATLNNPVYVMCMLPLIVTVKLWIFASYSQESV